MTIATKGTRRFGVVAGATALAFGLLGTSLAEPAAAQPASIEVTRAILNRQNATPAFQAPNRVLDDPDGDNLPNMTPDGRGGYMFYRGNFGRGAIYGHTRGTTTQAWTIYGNILAAWEMRGWETGAGYPVGNEKTPNLIERSICPAALRVQHFRKLSDSLGTTRMACYMPDAGTPFQVAWTG